LEAVAKQLESLGIKKGQDGCFKPYKAKQQYSETELRIAMDKFWEENDYDQEDRVWSMQAYGMILAGVQAGEIEL
jgi:hypothetical protein